LSAEGWLNPDVEKLWELQNLLTQLGDREKQLTSKPESFAAIDREWQQANDDMSLLEQSIESLSK
jgi:predicted  nucleic acid-binding Zn-ribbon protein